MKPLNLALTRGAPAVPVILRVTMGLIMAAHGWQKLTVMGAANFGNGMLAGLGVPAPVLMGNVVTYAELVGGILLIIGLGSRITAAVLALILAVATVLVKTDLGLIAPMGANLPGAELDLALIAGLVGVMLLGPGPLSVDKAIGIEVDTVTGTPGKTTVTV